TALEARVELSEAEREVRLLMLVAQLSGRAADACKAGDSSDRAEIVSDRRIKAIDADEVAALQRDPGERQARIDGVIEPCDPLDRLKHQIAGVERHGHRMIARDLEFLSHELAMAGRMLPGDVAAVEAWNIFP